MDADNLSNWHDQNTSKGGKKKRKKDKASSKNKSRTPKRNNDG